MHPHVFIEIFALLDAFIINFPVRLYLFCVLRETILFLFSCTSGFAFLGVMNSFSLQKVSNFM